MGHVLQFAVLQIESTGPTAEQLKCAFRSFSNLTDADAVRLSVGAHGILMRHLNQDAARALQVALRGEGVHAAIVAESDLPQLPEPQMVHRLELWPQALLICDFAGKIQSIPWSEVRFLAAGAAQSLQLNKTQTEFLRRQHAAPGVERNRPRPAEPRSYAQSQLVLEFLIGPSMRRYEVDAGQFVFKLVIDRPGLSLEEKFVWLVREMCHYAGGAIINDGARLLREGAQSVCSYVNRQALSDEIVWLLWRDATHRR